MCHGLWIAHQVELGGYLDKINAATNFLKIVSKVTFFGDMCFYYACEMVLSVSGLSGKAPDGANGWFRGLNRFKLDLSCG